jgi:hypothetical protein
MITKKMLSTAERRARDAKDLAMRMQQESRASAKQRPPVTIKAGCYLFFYKLTLGVVSPETMFYEFVVEVRDPDARERGLTPLLMTSGYPIGLTDQIRYRTTPVFASGKTFAPQRTGSSGHSRSHTKP